MLGCNQNVTFVRRIEDLEADRYEITVIHGVKCTEETRLQQDGRAMAAADVCTIVIPQDTTDFVPKKDDHVILGELPTVPEQLPTSAGIGLPVYRVTAVNDYRGEVLGHWKVIGS